MAKYYVVDESNDGYNAWIMWEGDDLEQGKKEARYYNGNDKRCHTILVEAEAWEDGNYNLIKY